MLASGAASYLPPLGWKREKGESSPTFSKANTTYLEAWELAHPHASEPQASPLPSALSVSPSHLHTGRNTRHCSGKHQRARFKWQSPCPTLFSAERRGKENSRPETTLTTKMATSHSSSPHPRSGCQKAPWHHLPPSRQGHRCRNTLL